MTMNRSKLLAVGWTAALTLAGCAGSEPAADATDDTSAAAAARSEAAPGEELVSQHQKIVEVRTEGTRRTRRQVGWLEYRFPVDDPEEGQYFVSDLDHVRLGFVLPAGQAFRYIVRDGEMVGTEPLGPGGLLGSVARILAAADPGLQISELELAPLGAPPTGR